MGSHGRLWKSTERTRMTRMRRTRTKRTTMRRTTAMMKTRRSSLVPQFGRRLALADIGAPVYDVGYVVGCAWPSLIEQLRPCADAALHGPLALMSCTHNMGWSRNE